MILKNLHYTHYTIIIFFIFINRAQNFSQIISGVTSQIQTSDGLDCIHSCDHVFWFGDLNYRINCGNYGELSEFNQVVQMCESKKEEDLNEL